MADKKDGKENGIERLLLASTPPGITVIPQKMSEVGVGGYGKEGWGRKLNSSAFNFIFSNTHCMHPPALQ